MASRRRVPPTRLVTRCPQVVGREIMKGWMNEREKHRKNQLEVLRRRGKGPPKKGSGKRSNR